MGWGHRYFIFGDDGSLRRIPLELANELVLGGALSEFAGQSLRVAAVTLELDRRQPVRIVLLQGSIWHFDKEGRVQPSLARSAVEVLGMTHYDQAIARREGIVDLSTEFRRRQWERLNRWEPTPADITRIVHAIWPEQAGRHVEKVRSIETSWKRRVPVSRQAKYIIGECRSHVWAIRHQVGKLEDSDFKGFAVEAAEHAAQAEDVVEAAIWEGVARAAERELERRRAWKARKGRWYAVVERTVWEGHDRSRGRSDVMEWVEAAGKDAAVEAGRELLRKHADQFDENTTVDVEIYPEIDWQPPR